MKNRIISLVMVLALVFTLLPVYAIADNTAVDEDVDSGMTYDQSLEIQNLIKSIKKALSSNDSLEQLKDLLPSLKDFYLPELIDGLGTQDASEFIEQLKALLSNEDGSIDSDVLSQLLGLFVGDDELDGFFSGGIDTDQLKTLLEEYLKGGTLDGLENLIPEGSLQALLDRLMENENFNDLFGDIDSNTLLDALKGLFGDSSDGSFDIDELLNGLTADDLLEALKKLLGDKVNIEDILGNLSNEQLKSIIQGLLNGNYNDFLEQFKNYNADDLAKILESLIGDNATLKKLLENLDVQQLKDVIAKLLNGDTDIGGILDNLSTDQLVELFKQLMGDSDTLQQLLDKLNSGDLGEILKKLLEGDSDFDINALFKNLDTYSVLKAIAGLLGSDLDVTGPNDVTVDEGKSATFSVKVNTAGTYKYMWLEPDAINEVDLSGIDLSGIDLSGIDLSGIDLSGIDLSSITKLISSLKKASLGNTDTLTIAKTTADDNGRTFACLIYNINGLKDITLFVTDEAKLTVNPAAPHEHTKVVDTPAVAATCTKDGCTEGSHCSECGEPISKSEVIPATDHNYLYKVCQSCGDEIPFPFVDVAKTDWYYSNVKYVWQHDIMNGVSDTKFAPDTKMTRAMFVTVLYRLEGSPDVTGLATPPFTDIGASNFTWAYNAIVWAYNTGVTKGTSATTFAPGSAISRQEIVTMLYRYAGSPTVSGSLTFGDSSMISSWARSAVQWANSIGVINGYPNGNFGPVDATTRSQMAAIVHRYMQLTSVL